jgi:phosphoglycerol geranylgeranyltransferase
VIATAYLLIESGILTSVQFMANTLPIPRAKDDIAMAHALAAEYLGMKLLYLEAGSGAREPVPDGMIAAVAGYCSLPIIVGGGIRDPEVARRKVTAGARFVVTGNLLEEPLTELRPRLRELAAAVHTRG